MYVGLLNRVWTLVCNSEWLLLYLTVWQCTFKSMWICNGWGTGYYYLMYCNGGELLFYYGANENHLRNLVTSKGGGVYLKPVK